MAGQALRGIKNGLRLGNWSRWLDEDETDECVDVWSLTCPLRYDVLLRRDAVQVYLAHRELHGSALLDVVKLFQDHPYRRWYTEVELPTFLPYIAHDPSVVNEMFLRRVKSLAELCDRIRRQGWDSRWKIDLHTGLKILPTATGKSVTAKYFVGNGCHRLAVLLALGCPQLRRRHFRVRLHREFTPWDMTRPCLDKRLIDRGGYFAFLSARYASPMRYEHENDLVRHVERHRPELLAELLSVLEADGMRTPASPGGRTDAPGVTGDVGSPLRTHRV